MSRTERLARQSGWFLAAVALITIVLATSASSIAAQDSESEVMDARRAQASDDLALVTSLADFQLRVPEWLPAGYELEYVAWSAPDPKVGTTAWSVDMWYSANDRPMIHIWQTSIPDLGEKDPTNIGEQLRVGGRDWRSLEGLRGVDTASAAVLSARLPDGVTISLDSGMELSDLVRLAESLAAVP